MLETLYAHTQRNVGCRVPMNIKMLRREVKCLEKDLFQKEKFYLIQFTEDIVVTKLVNNIMLDGKKGVAQKIVYDAFEKVTEKTGKDALEAFREALANITPVLEVKAPSSRWCYLPGANGNQN